MGRPQLESTMRGLTVLILLLVGLVDLGSSYTSIPDSVCHEKFGLDFCNCVQICNSLGECELVNATNCPIEAPTQAPSPRTDCSYDCDGWPYKQCEMSTRWGSASCINPFARRGSTTIYSNYPKCANVRDVMMSVPKEMENRISWTTNQEEAIQAAQELGMI